GVLSRKFRALSSPRPPNQICASEGGTHFAELEKSGRLSRRIADELWALFGCLNG
ncbi:hypothetical protein AVEN_88491-1, partial [Araneus ventricosus]